MHLLQTLIPLVLTLSLAGLVFAVGLNADHGDLLYLFRHPYKLLKAIVAVIVIPPVAAGLLVSLAPVAPIVKAAIMVMAVSPVPPLVPGKGLAAGARKEYVYGLYVALSLATVVSAPLVLAIAEAVFERHMFLPLASLLKTVIGGVIIPLALGVLVRRGAPAFAARSWTAISRIALALGILSIVPIAAKLWPAMTTLIGNGTVVAMAAATIVSLIGGHILGGPDPRDRATLAIASSVRHPGIALAIAGASFHEPKVASGILLFLLVGMIVSLPYIQWMKHHEAGIAAGRDTPPD
jgi:BASS family bile acid:Na+ symporter